MLSRPRTIRRASISIARTLMAAMLVLVLLSAIAPLSSFSSSHQCHMACCAGKAPHAEGSCSVAFASEIEPNATDDGENAAEQQSAHAHHGASAPAEESVSHDSHKVATGHSAHHSPSSHTESSQSLKAASSGMTAPCSPECAAAAVAPTHSRRPRDGAAMSFAGNPRPPTLVFINNVTPNIILPSSERRRQIRPRAPPTPLINPSA